MALDASIMAAAYRRFQADRDARQAELDRRNSLVRLRIPRLELIDRELGSTAAKIVIAAFEEDGSPETALRELERKNLELQRERAELLVGAGYPYDYIDGTPPCTLCGDSGYLRDGAPCRCLMTYYAREQNSRLSKLLDLGTQSFATFSFDWYSADVWPEYGRSPLENMKMIREICGNYAHTFGQRSGNLLFTGAPGLGKTFLSACIAREVSELADTLNFAAGELSKTEGLRREFVANVSHDLRTPLTMIKGYAEVMRDLPGENTPENVQIIIDEAGRLNDLVNDLLDLSRLQAGVMELNRTRFNLTASIREILGRYQRFKDYRFPFEPKEEAYVVADELKISQVVYNLVNNAVNYAGEDKTVSLEQALSGGRVRVSVTDTGEGIPADRLRDIWDRYYKVDREHRRAQVGTGLGLSIVKNVLDLHGGAYGVISQEGKGSTFWFELPIDTQRSSEG